ncbi:unnamed protein product (macronuclear) [Paramecium tetraurelia]|uniref:Uncharacterized protein n=1 Tax=Paramecium tetraurelia TaxID=5888 RepID=A0BZV0_PARTE|nr:uncharacterized protein GSPATT00005919001 [Paramecium tetraurelia]CAK64067.1 unnamed protein product [Paramecium tetraurelia]|eukprot:XP_001431465.1 hypothetical protein (macronuclear) [Paramecium tetraurelia strain d4-2]
MIDKNYHIKLNFSQATLNELRVPYFHVDNGCQFNQSDQSEIQVMKGICPICKAQKKENQSYDHIQQDDNLLNQIEQKNERQIVYKVDQKALYFMKRRNYTQDTISSITEVHQLQKDFYQNMREKKPITLERIQELALQRNQKYINCLQNFSESQQIPILMAVLNNKLVLFYHLYKLKVELNLLDVTFPKIRSKIQYSTHGVLQQIIFFEREIYFLFLKQNASLLFKGEFQQIFTQQTNQETLFQIKSHSNIKIDGPARLIEIEHDIKGQGKMNDLIMLGNRVYFSIKQNCTQEHYFDRLYSNTLFHYFVDNRQVLMVNQEEIRDTNKSNILYFCYDLSKPRFIQDPKNSTEVLPSYQKYDNYLTFGDQMVLFNTQELKYEKCNTLSLTSWLPNTVRANPLSMNVNVLNHQSYMQTLKITSTQKSMNSITCKLIGLRLAKKDLQQQDESDVFPALLVYNGQTSSFEVELI